MHVAGEEKRQNVYIYIYIYIHRLVFINQSGKLGFSDYFNFVV